MDGPIRPEPIAPRRILVALDGSAQAERVLPTVEWLALAAGARVTLVRVYPESQGTRGAVGAAGLFVETMMPIERSPSARNNRYQAEHYLEEVLARVRPSGLIADSEALDGDPGEMILDEAEGINADLIVLTSHGHGATEGRTLGSVAEYVIHRAKCPVLLAR